MASEIIIPIGLFMIVAYVIKVLSDNRLRHRLVEKGIIDENIKYLYADHMQVQHLSSLKWGLVLVGLGLAFLIGQIVVPEISDEVTVGAMFLFAGLGFLVYYFLAKRILAEEKSKAQ
ncbi:MAG: hypothetical protein Kow0042_16580 [Calditrichia bacterium]